MGKFPQEGIRSVLKLGAHISYCAMSPGVFSWYIVIIDLGVLSLYTKISSISLQMGKDLRQK